MFAYRFCIITELLTFSGYRQENTYVMCIRKNIDALVPSVNSVV